MATGYPYVGDPLKGAAAFTTIGEVSSQSQAAILLMLGSQMAGAQGTGSEGLESARIPQRGKQSAREAEEFPVPVLPDATSTIHHESLRLSIKKRFGVTRGKASRAKWERGLADCAADLYRKPEAQRAQELMELCLDHPMRLVRVAAAAAGHAASAEPGRLINILAEAVQSTDDLERDVAATALARLSPSHPALAKLTRIRKSRAKPRPAHTATMVHGTWAADGTWWRKGGDFFNYVRTLRDDLYMGNDYYRWTGGYSDAARADGAQRLTEWVVEHNELGLDLFGHSHGANVSLKATMIGMNAGTLYLLSCPVHWHKYRPDFSRVTRVVSVRVKLDLVILADLGGQRFSKSSGIEENVLDLWFNHGASHDPQVWKDHNVAKRVGL
jgi:hypothetical protein